MPAPEQQFRCSRRFPQGMLLRRNARGCPQVLSRPNTIDTFVCSCANSIKLAHDCLAIRQQLCLLSMDAAYHKLRGKKGVPMLHWSSDATPPIVHGTRPTECDDTPPLNSCCSRPANYGRFSGRRRSGQRCVGKVVHQDLAFFCHKSPAALRTAAAASQAARNIIYVEE